MNNLSNRQNKIIYLECSCSSEVLCLEYEEEEDELPPSLMVSIYELHKKMGFWQKLRFCWRIFRRGTPYGDQVVLDWQTAHNMRVWLNNLI